MEKKMKKAIRSGVKKGIKAAKFASGKAMAAASILLKLGLLTAMEGKNVAKRIVAKAKSAAKAPNPSGKSKQNRKRR